MTKRLDESKFDLILAFAACVPFANLSASRIQRKFSFRTDKLVTYTDCLLSFLALAQPALTLDSDLLLIFHQQSARSQYIITYAWVNQVSRSLPYNLRNSILLYQICNRFEFSLHIVYHFFHVIPPFKFAVVRIFSFLPSAFGIELIITR